MTQTSQTLKSKLKQAGQKRPPSALRTARRRRMTLAWSVWVMAALFVLFQFFLQLSSGEIIAGLMKSFELTAFGGGVVASAYYYIYVILQTPAGMLMDRFGPRRLLSAGAATVSVGCIIFGTAHLVSVAVVGRILMGTGAAFAFVGCLQLIAKWFPMRRFAMMVAVVETCGMLGTMIGEFSLAHFIQTTGWRVCMVVAGIAAGLIAVLLWVVVRNAPRNKLRQMMEMPRLAVWDGVKRLVRNERAWINGCYSGLMFSILTVFVALWAIPFLQLAHHINLMTASLIAAMMYGGVAVGGPIMGWLDGRTYLRRKIMVISAFLSAILLSMIIFWVQLPLYAITILMFITGLFASSYVLTFAVANEIAIPANRATCIGFTNMLCVGFAPILQPLIGYLINMLGRHETHIASMHHTVWHFEVALSVMPICALIAAILGFFQPNRIYGRKVVH